MLYFFLALFFSVGILVIFRFFKTYNVSNLEAIIVSYFVSAALAIGFSLDNIEISQIIVNQNILAIILGISFFIGFVFLSLSTQKSGISITSVASNISVIIPVLVAAILYHEKIESYRLAGLILSIPAFYFFFKPNKNSSFKWSLLLFPLIIFIISGLNNSLLRHAENLGAMDSPMVFLGLIFLIAFIISLIYSGLSKKIKTINTKVILFGIVLGIANFSSTFFFLKSLSIFSSALFFPIYNLSFIAFSALIGILFFKEKFSKANYFGLVLAGLAILLMNYMG